METTTKILFISIFFCSAAPSMLFSSEKEERNREELMNHKLVNYALKIDKENCKKLLEANADPDWRNEDGMTPLDMAWAKATLNPNKKTRKVFQLLHQASANQKQR